MKNSIDNAIKGICCEEGVAEQELRLGVRTRKFSRARVKIAYHLRHGFEISRAEIGRQLRVCASGKLYKDSPKLLPKCTQCATP
jgi:hypothetical protein